MKVYTYYNCHKTIFLGTIQYKKYYDNNVFELYYEEGDIITILCEDEYYIDYEEFKKILNMNKKCSNNDYSCIIDNYKKTFIYINDQKYEYDKWLSIIKSMKIY